MRELRSLLWVLGLSSQLGTAAWASPDHRTPVASELGPQGHAAVPAVPATAAFTLPALEGGGPLPRPLSRTTHAPAAASIVAPRIRQSSAPVASAPAHGLLGLSAMPATAPPRP